MVEHELEIYLCLKGFYETWESSKWKEVYVVLCLETYASAVNVDNGAVVGTSMAAVLLTLTIIAGGAFAYYRQRMQLLIISITESSHQGYRLPPNEEVPEIPTIYEPYSGVQFGNTIKDENNVEKTEQVQTANTSDDPQAETSDMTVYAMPDKKPQRDTVADTVETPAVDNEEMVYSLPRKKERQKSRKGPAETYYSFVDRESLSPTAIKVQEFPGKVLSEDYKTKMKDQFEKLASGFLEPHEVSLKPENRPKNRYDAIYPYDSTRVVLQPETSVESDYINASYIHGFHCTREYIATQGPSKTTFEDFWKMVWQNNCGKIVMLVEQEEVQNELCDQYWPSTGTKIYGNCTVALINIEAFTDFTIRYFKVQTVQNPEVSREVVHFHFHWWPDKGVPKSVSSLVKFRHRVKETKTAADGQLLVHCSAGVGRTGTFIALNYLADQAKEIGYVDVAECVKTLRRQRVNMVQTLDQYIFLHKAVAEALKPTAPGKPSVNRSYENWPPGSDPKKMSTNSLRISKTTK